MKESKVPRVKRDRSPVLRLRCDDPSDSFVAQHTNQGEPFREGILIGIENQDFDKNVTVMLEDREAIQLRDLLNKHYPV